MKLLTPIYLRAVRAEALRKRIWYKALDCVERGIVNLTIEIVDALSSGVLIKQIVGILVKLREAGKSAFTRHLEGFGVLEMRRVVEAACVFGSSCAFNWFSCGFAEYLGFIDFNNPVGWRSF